MADTNPSNPSPPSSFYQQPYYINGKIVITALIILFVIVLFTIAFHIYTRVFWRRARGFLHHDTSSAPSQPAGLEKAIVETLPTFTYNMQPLMKDEEGGGAVARAGVTECAVCLAEFQEDDRCRLLPKCSHSFHADCIDTWFLSNTTCPLCRTSAEPGGCEEETQAESSMACLLPHSGMDGYTNGGIRSDLGDGSEHRDGSSLWSSGRTCEMRAVEGQGINGGDDSMTIQAQEQCDGAVRQRARTWQRSISERFVNRDAHFRANILLWGSQSRVGSCSISDHHWQVGGRSLSHMAIDVARLEEISPLPQSALSSPAQCFSSGEMRPDAAPSATRWGPLSRLNSLRRLLNREKKVVGQAEYNEI